MGITDGFLSISNLVALFCVLSEKAIIDLVEVTFLLEIWMFATLDICIL